MATTTTSAAAGPDLYAVAVSPCNIQANTQTGPTQVRQNQREDGVDMHGKKTKKSTMFGKRVQQ